MSKRHRRVFSFPSCIYCGGIEAATTVDHVPPRTMFAGRARPKGLEFPSCSPCNSGTRKSELVASVLSRVYPDAVGEAAEAELQKLFKAVNSHVPGLLKEMLLPRAKAKFTAQKYGNPNGGFLKLGGPLVSMHLNAFAAKMGFAMHFHATGSPVPIGGGVLARFFTNIDAINDQLPNDLISLMGNPRTLVQGGFHVGDQFRFQTIRAEDSVMSASYSSFRQSFSIVTFAADTTSKLVVEGELPAEVFKPGDLQKISAG